MGDKLDRLSLAHIVPKVRKKRTAETCLNLPYLAAWYYLQIFKRNTRKICLVPWMALLP